MKRCCSTLGKPGLDPGWSCALLYYLLLVSKYTESLHISPLMCWGPTPIPAPLTPCWCAPPADTGWAAKQPTLLSPLPQYQQNRGVDVGGKAQPPCLHDGLWLVQACIDLSFLNMHKARLSKATWSTPELLCYVQHQASQPHRCPARPTAQDTLQAEDQDVWRTEVFVRLSP